MDPHTCSRVPRLHPAHSEEKGSGVTSPNPWAGVHFVVASVGLQIGQGMNFITSLWLYHLSTFSLQHALLAQGFGLVTPDPFSLRELGGVWAQD